MVSNEVVIQALTLIGSMFTLYMAYMTTKLNRLNGVLNKTHDLVNEQSLTLARLRVSTSTRLGNTPEDIKEKTEAVEDLRKKEAERAEIDAKK